MTWFLIDKESRNIVAECETEAEAVGFMIRAEEFDRKRNMFVPDSYDIICERR
ncbi:MAG: hypothetical protein IJ366_00390 [Clostridia bacterium]|nr:hypothetical protein [Clostridia bacterium]MBQ7792957.1 hypothetical protein [Clostridia bacterium]